MTLRSGKHRLQRLDGALGTRRSVDRHDHDAVGDDEVHMRGGHGLAHAVRARGRGSGCGRPRASARARRSRLRALRAISSGSRRSGRRRPRAIGTRRGQALRSGRDCRYARRCGRSRGPGRARRSCARRKRRRSAASGLRLGPAIAIGVEQGLARREQRAFAVMLDRAAFQHEIEAAPACAGSRAMSSPTVSSSGRSNLPPHPLVRNASDRSPVRRSREDRARCRAARCRRSGPG